MLLFKALRKQEDGATITLNDDEIRQTISQYLRHKAQGIIDKKIRSVNRETIGLMIPPVLVLLGLLAMEIEPIIAIVIALIIAGAVIAYAHNKASSIRNSFKVKTYKQQIWHFKRENLLGVNVLCDTAEVTDAETIKIPFIANLEELNNACNKLDTILNDLEEDLLDHSNMKKHRISGNEHFSCFSSESLLNDKLEILSKEIDDISLPVLKRHFVSNRHPIYEFLNKNISEFTSVENPANLPSTEGKEINVQMPTGNDIIHELLNKLESANDNLKKILLTNDKDFGSLQNEFIRHRNMLTAFSLRSFIYAFCPSCHSDFTTAEDLSDYTFRINSVCKYDKVKETWVCKMCSEKTDLPIAIPKLYHDVILPTGRYLLEENRVERLKIYHDIDNQLTKFEQDFRKEMSEIKSQGDVIIENIENHVMVLNSEIEFGQEHLQSLKYLLQQNQQELKRKSDAFADAINQIKVEIMKSTQKEMQEYSEKMEALNQRASQVFSQASKEAQRIENQQMAYLRAQKEAQEKQLEIDKEQLQVSKEQSEDLKAQRAISEAIAAKQGVTQRSWLAHPVSETQKGINNVTNSLSGGSELDLAKKNMNLN